MLQNFNKSFELTKVSEGGWSDHPRDPGGATMKGVTFRVYQAYRKQKRQPPPTKTDLKNISEEEVREIYQNQYWDAVRGNELPAGIDFAVFDYAINSGPRRAVEDLQRTVGVAADGKVGMMTKNAVRDACIESADDLIDKYCNRRLAFLKRLKTWSTFGKGWTRRVESVRRNAKAMARDMPVEMLAVPTIGQALPSDTAVLKTGTGKAVATTVAGAAGTAVAASADRIMTTATEMEGNVLWIAIAAFVILTVVGAIITAVFVKDRIAEEG